MLCARWYCILLLLWRMCYMLLLDLLLMPLLLLLPRLLMLHSMHLQGLSCGARSLLLLLWRWCCFDRVSRMHTLAPCWCMLPLVLI